ncbi:MAG: site-specific integrase [Spirochaetota bacterium]
MQEDPAVAIMFAALFCLLVSAGLRPGEGRAIHLDQLYRKAGGIIVDRAYDDRTDLVDPKKSRADDPRYRVAYVPEKTWRILDYWLERRKEPQDWPGLLFHYHGAPIGTGYVADRLAYGLAGAGVNVVGRRISPHSCRYTYDTKMKHVLPPGILREFIGHRSEQMTDHYDRMTGSRSWRINGGRWRGSGRGEGAPPGVQSLGLRRAEMTEPAIDRAPVAIEANPASSLPDLARSYPRNRAMAAMAKPRTGPA